MSREKYTSDFAASIYLRKSKRARSDFFESRRKAELLRAKKDEERAAISHRNKKGMRILEKTNGREKNKEINTEREIFPQAFYRKRLQKSTLLKPAR